MPQLNERDQRSPRLGPRQYHEDYRFAMSGAHRKPAHPIGTPALTWHRGYWKDYTKAYSSVEQWIESIEYFVTGIVDTLNEHRTQHGDCWPYPVVSNLLHAPPIAGAPTDVNLLRNRWHIGTNGKWEKAAPNQDGQSDGIATRYEAVQIDGTWKSFPLTIRIEVFEEFFTLSASLDLSLYEKTKCDKHFDSGFSRYSITLQALEKVIRVTESRAEAIKRNGPGLYTPKGPDRETLEAFKTHEKLYLEIWDELQRDIFSEPLNRGDAERLGSIFADFRGLVLGLDFTDRTALTLTRPGAARPPCSLAARIAGRVFFERDATETVDALLPILLASEPGHQVDHSPGGSIEYTFSTFGGKRSIYGSGFGPQYPSDKKGGNPLTYVVLVGHDERRQIGRMIARLHMLGSLRLAAMAGFRDVLMADEKLPDLERELDSVESEINEATPRRPSAIRLMFQSKVKQNRAISLDPERIEKVLDQVANALKDIDSTVGRISHRQTRLHYYSDRFGTFCHAMRIGRISGFQKYDEFVSHRIDRAYARINAFSSRHYALRNQLEVLRRNLTGKKTEEHQREIRTIQNVAEIFFLLVLFPYYATDLVHKAGMELSDFVVPYLPEWFTSLFHWSTDKYTDARVIFTGGLLFLVYRQRHTIADSLVRALISIRGVWWRAASTCKRLARRAKQFLDAAEK